MEQRSRTRPKTRQQGLHLIAQHKTLLHQIVTRTHKRAHGFDGVRRRHQQPEAMTVCAQYIRQQIGITEIVLSTRSAVAWTARLDGIWMDRYDRMTEGHRSIDDQPRWPFNGNGDRRGGCDSLQLLLEGLQTVCIVAYLGSQQGLSCLVYDTDGMMSATPIQSGEILHSAPRIHGFFRVRRSGGLLTNRRSWDNTHGASSCSLSRLPAPAMPLVSLWPSKASFDGDHGEYERQCKTRPQSAT
jgi:hypothetical protein